MRYVLKFGALFAALFLAVLPACALVPDTPVAHHGGAVVFLLGSLLGVAGVVVTYCWPVQGIVGPTQAQASQVSIQTALVQLLDGDTQALFTHNWGSSNGLLAASFPSFLFPIIICEQVLQGNAVATLQVSLTFSVANTNVVVINKATGTGSGGTFIVALLRPHSFIS